MHIYSLKRTCMCVHVHMCGMCMYVWCVCTCMVCVHVREVCTYVRHVHTYSIRFMCATCVCVLLRCVFICMVWVCMHMCVHMHSVCARVRCACVCGVCSHVQHHVPVCGVCMCTACVCMCTYMARVLTNVPNRQHTSPRMETLLSSWWVGNPVRPHPQAPRGAGGPLTEPGAWRLAMDSGLLDPHPWRSPGAGRAGHPRRKAAQEGVPGAVQAPPGKAPAWPPELRSPARGLT